MGKSNEVIFTKQELEKLLEHGELQKGKIHLSLDRGAEAFADKLLENTEVDPENVIDDDEDEEDEELDEDAIDLDDEESDDSDDEEEKEAPELD